MDWLDIYHFERILFKKADRYVQTKRPLDCEGGRGRNMWFIAQHVLSMGVSDIARILCNLFVTFAGT